jgi:hypothetical protein
MQTGTFHTTRTCNLFMSTYLFMIIITTMPKKRRVSRLAQSCPATGSEDCGFCLRGSGTSRWRAAT